LTAFTGHAAFIYNNETVQTLIRLMNFLANIHAKLCYLKDNSQ